MTPEELAYTRHRLVLAKETLEDAQILFERGHLHSTVNRLYYACFYTAEALLRTEGMISTKHSGVRSLLDVHWAKTGRLPLEMAHFYRKIFEQRHRGDYGVPVDFARDAVAEWVDNAESFVSLGAAIVDNALAGR